MYIIFKSVHIGYAIDLIHREVTVEMIGDFDRSFGIRGVLRCEYEDAWNI